MTDWGRLREGTRSNLGETDFRFRLMSVTSDRRSASANQKIQVGAQVCLQDVLDVEPNPAAIGQRCRFPLRAPGCQCGVINIQA